MTVWDHKWFLIWKTSEKIWVVSILWNFKKYLKSAATLLTSNHLWVADQGFQKRFHTFLPFKWLEICEPSNCEKVSVLRHACMPPGSRVSSLAVHMHGEQLNLFWNLMTHRFLAPWAARMYVIFFKSPVQTLIDGCKSRARTFGMFFEYQTIHVLLNTECCWFSIVKHCT